LEPHPSPLLKEREPDRRDKNDRMERIDRRWIGFGILRVQR
jgi:hypothetical protein